MKPLPVIAVFLFLSCNNHNTPKDTLSGQRTDTVQPAQKKEVFKLPASKADRAKFHTNKDTVYIYSQSKDTVAYSKEEFNDIVDNFPELYETPVISPDSAYDKSSLWVDLVDSAGNKKRISFGSEAGQDEYYILYAYFLKHKNGIGKYTVRRKKLHEIYNTLNSLFGDLQYGGTYFGHQYSRIEGYAEFSVYWFSHYEDYFDRPYDITKQKKYYIQGLKQLISDEIEIDYNTIEKKAKADRRKALFKKVDYLDRLITDNFYLRMAKSFESDHY